MTVNDHAAEARLGMLAMAGLAAYKDVTHLLT